MLNCLRYLHISSIQNARKRINPGIAKQLKVFDAADIEDDPEGDFESDFMEVHKSHRQFEREAEQLRQKTRHKIVENKYFKEKQPNFLTFAEKEQIKLLHSRDPEEWTVEKLAESFPASPEIVKQILKANWTPKSKKRIVKHDETVIKNWETLQKGGFSELKTSLKEHLGKFAARTFDDIQQNQKIYDNWKKEELPKPITNEFLSIITNFKKHDNPQALVKADEIKDCKSLNPFKIPGKPRNDDTYLSAPILDRRNMRFQEFKKENFPDLLLETSNCDISSASTSINQNEMKEISEFQSNEIVLTQNDRQKYEMDCIKEQIYIPRKLRQKDAIYKIDDCYYDDDGEFLYRVPGMKK